jgi:hypothetical protein
MGLVVLYLFTPPMTEAAVLLEINCGDTVGPSGIFTATDADADMATCTTSPDPALTIVGPVTVNLGAIMIGNDDLAIQIEGSRARVTGGHVIGTSSGDGVNVGGTGQHIVSKMEVEMADFIGMEVDSSNNQILGCLSHDNSNDGIRDSASLNRYTGNISYNNGDDGYEDDNNGSNTWTRNLAHNNSDDGWDIDSSNNQFSYNRATNNGNDGFDQDQSGETGNSFFYNTALYNDREGFEFDGDSNTVRGNVSNYNGTDGFEFDSGSNSNVITYNRAAGNAIFDAQDENAMCDANTWRNNRFLKRNQACVR